MEKHIKKSQGRGGKTGSSCEGMVACQEIAACEIMQQQIKSQGRGGRTGLSSEVVLACEINSACGFMEMQINIARACSPSSGVSL